MKLKPYDKHHIIPSSRKLEGFKTDDQLNIARLRRTTHQRIHALFDNMTPQEQLNLILDINKKVLSDEVVKRILEILRMTKEEFYQLSIVK